MLQYLEEIVLSLYSYRINWQQYLYGYFFFVFGVSALEDMGIPASSDFMGDGVLLRLTNCMEEYPQSSPIFS